MKVLSLVLVVVTIITQLSVASAIRGSVQLNSGTFDQLVGKFKATLVKFDKEYPAGEKHEVFVKLVEDLLTQPQLLVAQVNVQEYGDEGDELPKRFKIKPKDYPKYRLFLQHSLSDAIRFEGNESNGEEIRQFASSKSGLWIGKAGCIEEFDILAKRFIHATSEAKQEIIKEAEEIHASIVDSESSDRARVYVKAFQKVSEVGYSFLKQELVRIEKLREGGKVSDRKKVQLKYRSNILRSIQQHAK